MDTHFFSVCVEEICHIILQSQNHEVYLVLLSDEHFLGRMLLYLERLIFSK